MRRDVKNVIAERPKANRTWASKTPRKKVVTLDGDGEQLDESTNHVRQGRQKLRNTRFNLLERFLIHRVGRSWSKVYAEACKNADSRSFQGAELRDALKNLVATDCWIEGKNLMGRDWRGCPEPVKGLYVDPKTGILSRKELDVPKK
ncbi:MAG: hypothetical protein WB679_04935 [Terracidiphilus sp.]